MPEGRNRPSPALLFSRRFVNNDQLVMTLLAVVIGAIVGTLAILFIEKIDVIQTFFLGISGEWIANHVAELPTWRVLLVPTLGGLLVGLLLYYFMPGRMPKGPADVIEACETKGGHMSGKEGILAALASGLSLGSGASVGREGPAVHLGGSFGGWAAEKLQLRRSNARVLLGCGVAAAVAASFNAPIAGALFAQEVILSHYALKAFAPVVVASVTGTVVARQIAGQNHAAFHLDAFALGSYLEFPAFATLGIFCGFLGILFVVSILNTQKHVARLPGPRWYKPALGGFFVGVIALQFPEVLGVGYEATDNALRGNYALDLLIALCVFKLLATVFSLGFGFAGGVFSPSLVIGAMFGAVFGHAMSGLFPEIASGANAYALVGMASMAAAVLGAPISTTVIIFELTSDYTLTIAVLVGCVMATAVNTQMGRQSFFHEQLKARGLDLLNDYSNIVLKDLSVSQVLRRQGAYVSVDAPFKEIRKRLRRAEGGVLFVISHDRSLYGAIRAQDLPDEIFKQYLEPVLVAADLAERKPAVVQTDDDLQIASDVMKEAPYSQLAVVSSDDSRAYLGCIDAREITQAQTRELLSKRREEEGRH